MEKIYYLLGALLFASSSLMGNPAIEECIKNLDQKALREIIAQGLVMRSEDKDKYLSQVAKIIKQAHAFNQEKRAVQPQGYTKIQWNKRKLCIAYSILAVLAIVDCSCNISEKDTDKKKWQYCSVMWPIPAYFCYAAFKACMNARSSTIISNVLKKAITMQALLKNIPITAN